MKPETRYKFDLAYFVALLWALLFSLINYLELGRSFSIISFVLNLIITIPIVYFGLLRNFNKGCNKIKINQKIDDLIYTFHKNNYRLTEKIGDYLIFKTKYRVIPNNIIYLKEHIDYCLIILDNHVLSEIRIDLDIPLKNSDK